jgi:nitrite reductase/ring-hydroxylating ferredoxin subunit
VIVCPRHNFEFDLEIGLSPCEPERLRIKTYRAGLEGDEVVVYVQGAGP